MCIYLPLSRGYLRRGVDILGDLQTAGDSVGDPRFMFLCKKFFCRIFRIRIAFFRLVALDYERKV